MEGKKHRRKKEPTLTLGVRDVCWHIHYHCWHIYYHCRRLGVAVAVLVAVVVAVAVVVVAGVTRTTLPHSPFAVLALAGLGRLKDVVGVHGHLGVRQNFKKTTQRHQLSTFAVWSRVR